MAAALGRSESYVDRYLRLSKVTAEQRAVVLAECTTFRGMWAHLFPKPSKPSEEEAHDADDDESPADDPEQEVSDKAEDSRSSETAAALEGDEEPEDVVCSPETGNTVDAEMDDGETDGPESSDADMSDSEVLMRDTRERQATVDDVITALQALLRWSDPQAACGLLANALLELGRIDDAHAAVVLETLSDIQASLRSRAAGTIDTTGVGQ